ncbi:MAG: hypothetical protein IPJ89_00150 [Candidatus Iainarchaeum archaeon]|uniref:Uncharacterized protein n=1 Tax=Candidatus Iainarchaeum sp. TaxID=3101447 RepID=A0A7T9I150_9ARCH|nr:MAG: hypothetical protein IPJ89_00150 [Candidatus Diapherotrites archaeon]
MFALPIDVIAGVCAGVLLFRLGLPSLIPLLVWVPLAQSVVSIGFMLGLITTSIWQLARPLFAMGHGIPFGVWISIACAGAGLILVEHLLEWLPLLDGIVAPLLLLAVGWLLFLSAPEKTPRYLVVVSACAAGALGWLTLHVWAIPLALPALLMGLFGFTAAKQGEPVAQEEQRPLRESVIGVALGVLPGLGPGLMGLLWNSNRFSPFTAIANLIFSLGYVALSGKVRSMPAELLSSSGWEWSELFVVLLGAVCIAWGFEQLLPAFSFSISLEHWSFLQVLALILLGNNATLLVVGAAWSWSRLMRYWGIDLSLGLLVLIPPIVWFYS